MPKFGKRSKKELATAHPDLQRLFNAVIERIDCAVICGHRGHADQDKAFAEGKSKLEWPNSKHNKVPALAVDVVPFPIDWNDLARFDALAAVVKAEAKRLNIKVECGIDWKKFPDAPHYQMPG
ncbi:MAG: M15 family metallopeptidase [Elusimicrobia bacterium]|nr:M15 family metallopeptidase [Elusimicrobiota bacterium]MBK7546192.1 M15 family metallopeptidase [Elusimicrobiota bacterium]